MYKVREWEILFMSSEYCLLLLPTTKHLCQRKSTLLPLYCGNLLICDGMKTFRIKKGRDITNKVWHGITNFLSFRLLHLHLHICLFGFCCIYVPIYTYTPLPATFQFKEHVIIVVTKALIQSNFILFNIYE